VQDGKTGKRKVFAFKPEWIEVFELKSAKLPKVNARRNSDYGQRICQYFRRNAKLPFSAYNLRHAWAVRTIEYGLPDALSAQQMGHSLQVHNETYQAWIGFKTHQEMYEKLTKNSNKHS
jgi:integrase